MLQFSENKKPRKREIKAKTKSAQIVDDSSSDSEIEVKNEVTQRRPAWVDTDASKLKVSIEDVSRLRKLKKTEDEKVIEGAEYATRLKEHYISKMQAEHSMFAWAKP